MPEGNWHGSHRLGCANVKPIYWPRMSAQCLMSTTMMNYALGGIVVVGALAVTLAFLVW